MNDTMLEETIKDAHEQAFELHCKVLAARDGVADAICNFAMHLKAMRDGKEYKMLGYSSFDDYIDKGVKIGKRQVYNFISTYESLGFDVMQSNAQLRITKLQLLTQVSDIDRSEFIEQNDLEGMSVKEIKELIAKSKEQVEQISFLTEQVQESKQVKSDIDILAAERDMLLLQVSELENRPVEVAVIEPSQADIDKITSDLKKQFEADKKLAIENAEATAIAKAKKEHLKLIDDAVKKAKADKSDEIKKALEQADKEKSELLEKSERLAKELSINGDADLVAVSVLFDGMKDQYDKLLKKISDIMQQNESKGMNLASAVHKYLTDIAAPAIYDISGV